MRAILLSLAFALPATAVLAQDAPPPGCRWQGFQGDTILACKDGKGYWRRSGDDMVVGTYPIAQPKPKPVAAAPKTSAPAGAATTGAPVVAKLEPPAPPPPPDEAAIAAAETAQATDAARVGPPAAAPAEPEPADKAPWWKAFLDRLWRGVLSFLKLIGVVR